MNRQQAKKLLSALIFDDLDEASKAELLAYLETDDELRDLLADMRMAAKVTTDAVNQGPDPVLSKGRLEDLQRLAKPDKARIRLFMVRRMAAVAAVLLIGVFLVGILVPSLSTKVRYQTKAGRAMVEERMRQLSAEVGAPEPTPGKAMPDVLSLSGDYSTISNEDRLKQTYRWRGELVEKGITGGALQDRSSGANLGYFNRLNIATDGRSEGVESFALSKPVQPVSPPVAADDLYVQLGQKEQASEAKRPMPETLTESVGRPAIVAGQPASGPTSLSQMGGAQAQKTDSASGVKWFFQDGRWEQVPPGMGGSAGGTGMGGTGMRSARLPSGGPQEQARLDQARPDASVPALGRIYQVVHDKGGTESPARRAGEVAAAGKPVPLSAAASTPVLGEAIAATNKKAEMTLGVNGPLDSDALMPAQKERRIAGRDIAGKNEVMQKLASKELNGVKAKGLEEDAAILPAESRFKVVPVNPWIMTDRDPLSTFGLDVDTASYALCRRYIRSGFLPPVGAVRMEEFINAFDYAYPQRDNPTFAVYAEGAPSPFAPTGQEVTLLKIAVKARTVGRDQRRPAHLVFVVDTSASMGQADRLPLVQSGLRLLVDRLSAADRVSLVTCADEARLHLEAVSAGRKEPIRQMLDAIQPAGPTNLLAGLKLGYSVARRAFVAGQINQVVLCSDGVANVGQIEAEAVLQEVAADRRQGVTLTCVGVGYGAYNDAFLEAMADRGDGRYVFLDPGQQAQEALAGQLADTLQTVARDARIQIQFNPGRVRRYRLIGYENRDIEDQRFRDDTVDAGEVGSGQCSTALYELELIPHTSGQPDSDLGTVFVRYRHADTGQVEEISRPIAGSIIRRRSVEEDPRFFLAAGVSRFAEWLRQSEHCQHTALAEIQRVLDQVSAALPLDRDVQDLAVLAHQAESLPRAQ